MALDRRHFTSRSAATITKLGTTGAAAAVEIGPVETRWREFLRRQNVVAEECRHNGADISEEQAHWFMSPISDACRIKPTTEREWAAFVLVALYTSRWANQDQIDTVLATIDGLLGKDADVYEAMG